MEKVSLKVHQDEFEYARSIFDTAYYALNWVNEELEARGIALRFELNEVDHFEDADE